MGSGQMGSGQGSTPAEPSGDGEAVLAIAGVSAAQPPVALASVVSMALVVVGGIYMASYIPRHAPLGPAYALLGLSAAVLVSSLVMLVRIRSFAWQRFFVVAKWALLGYVVEAGMLEFVFVFDGLRSTMLVILTLMLAIFAVDIPVLLAFSVAGYQEPDLKRS